MNRVINRARALGILALLLAVGVLFFVFEFLVYGKSWVMFPGSPHVYGSSAGSSVVTDRNGTELLNTSSGKDYAEDAFLRAAMIHWLGDRQGNISTPLLSHYAQEMVGYDMISGVYRYGNSDAQVKLTVSAEVQAAALKAMGSYKGTVAVYNYKTGEILCAVSTPAFDPDNVPDIAGDTEGLWDGVYVNRFLKSSYTPGSIFKIVTAAAALETIPDIQQQTFTCTGLLEYGIDKVTCMREHGELSFRDAFMNSCNCAFAQIADQLGGEVLQRFAQQLGITESIYFDGLTTAAGSIQAQGAADVLVAWSAIGQHKDLINPCQFMTLVGSIASGGNGAKPYLVAEVSGEDWISHTAQTEQTGRVLSRETCEVLRQMMRNNVENYYGDEHFGGLTVCAKSGTAEVGGSQKPNAMFTGFVDDETYPLAFIVAVEDAGFGRQICIPILSQILAQCKLEMDKT